MTSPKSLLSTLQHSDSFFPSGTTSFSWGMETLFTEGAVLKSDDIKSIISAQLKNRWASLDRGALLAAFDDADDIGKICVIDSIVESHNSSTEIREGSHRAGLALLHVHEKLGTSQAETYKRFVKNKKAFANQTVMQGFLWAKSGILRNEAELMSAHGLCIGLLGAAIRLGAIGHINAQLILRSLHKIINELIDKPPPRINDLNGFTPESEIAMMRHETAGSRLFAN